MSRDIRSFFQLKKVQKVQLEEGDDIIPESPDVEIKVKKREKRKKRILSDSDEETFSTKKKKNNEDGCKSSHKVSKHKSPIKPKLKEVKAVDLFGAGPIKRTEPIVKKVQNVTETGIHSDDDFDQSLLELDETEKDIKVEINSIIPNKVTKQTEILSTKNIKLSENKAHKSLEIRTINDNDIIDVNSLKNNETDIALTKTKRKHVDELSSVDTEQIKHRQIPKSKEPLNKLQKSTDRDIGSIESKEQVPEFVENVTTVLNKSEIKCKNLEISFNDSVSNDEERYERKRQSAALYQKYLNRSGPKHLGAKEIPEGAPNCLKGCSFLLTGVLDSFEREEVAATITKFGGAIKNSISKKVTYVIAGDEAGPAKIAKAQEFGIGILNEDDFLELIVIKSKEQISGKSETKETKKHQNNLNKKSHKDKNITLNENTNRIQTSTTLTECVKDSNNMVVTTEKDAGTYNYKSKSIQRDDNVNNPTSKSEITLKSHESTNKDINDLNCGSNNKIHATSPQSTMWVEKYKPQTLKQIIGQHGEASNVKKLSNWLTKWYMNRKAKLPKPSPWSKNDDGGYYKAALLSGPPGVGKTTTVSLVCKELGFDMVEFNASDTRNKTLIKQQIGELLTTTSLSGYAKGLKGKQAVTKKHVLVMDEVDGMAGNEDRGGLQELISLIKAAAVPIICMCNDRNSQKMRTLVNYCYDLRFNRPRVDQIKAAMMSVCCKEGVKVSGEALAQLIAAARQDVRQTLTLLSLWAAGAGRAHPDTLLRDAANTKKDIQLGPWEAIRKVFSAEEHKNMSIHDKSDLFFYDYSLAPLFVQENYLQVAPHCPKNKVLERLSKAADSISVGDLVDARIRGAQAWSLLPVQAMYSSVIPGHAMSGHITGQIQFPGWLGKNSRRSKMHRLCQEIHAHTRLSTSGSKSSIFLDYCTHLRDAIVAPLIKEKSDGIAQSLSVLESYHLLREDLESLTELSLWPGQRNPMILIDSKVKAAMTRTYNKKAMALPYAPGAVRRGRAAGADADADADADPDADSDDVRERQEDSDPENDALIKKKKFKENEKSNARKDAPSTSKDKSSSSKGKGKKK